MRLDFDASVVAWLDNFLFATKTEAQLEKVIETFKKVSEEANVNLHEVSREHSFLGFEANMTDHTPSSLHKNGLKRSNNAGTKL